MWKDSKNPQDRKKPQSTQWHQAPPPAPMGSSPYRGGVVWGSLWPLELRQQGHPSWTGQRVETRPRVIPPMYQVDQLNHQDLLAVCWHQLHWRECVPALVLLPPSEPQLLFFTKCNYIDYWDDFDLPWPLLVTWSQPDAPVMAEVISELEMIPSQHRQCSRGINTKWICGLSSEEPSSPNLWRKPVIPAEEKLFPQDSVSRQPLLGDFLSGSGRLTPGETDWGAHLKSRGDF